MNPWELILDLLGWVVLGILALIVVMFVVALIVAVVKSVRKPRDKGTQILKSE